MHYSLNIVFELATGLPNKKLEPLKCGKGSSSCILNRMVDWITPLECDSCYTKECKVTLESLTIRLYIRET